MLKPLALAAATAAAPVAAHALAVGNAFSEIQVSIVSATSGSGAGYFYLGDAEFDDVAFGSAGSFSDGAHVPPAVNPGPFDSLVGGDPILDLTSSSSIGVVTGGVAIADSTANAFILIQNPSNADLIIDLSFDYALAAAASLEDPALETVFAGSTVVLETFDPNTGDENVIFTETFFADGGTIFGPGGSDSGTLTATFTVAPGAALDLVAFVGASASGAAEANVPLPAGLPLLAFGAAALAALRRRT